ncbi:MAG: threonine--tRNA ligase [Dehalococcoidia bacterium]|nr:threonine--tRNA ligase [Dehalococcoidia bacterium]MYK26206.1 threonine--tRNA ligase [Dehalococcoidia bacterium]
MPEPIEDHVDLAALEKEERLSRMRHSAAHVLAEAMVELMPEAEVGIGPPTDTGFYYDFLLPRALTQEDLTWLRRRMRKSIGRRLPFQMSSITREEAEEQWADQPFKLELIADIEDDDITQCTHGQFTDLCRGGHVNHTGEIPAFKLMSIAGAYWRGDENNPQLQRVYGALFETQEELDEYERRLEEARKRDHRRVGRDLGLFTFSDVVGQGIPLFLPKGETVRHLMESYVRELQERAGHKHVWTANVVKGQLYERSGHREHYADAMFPPMVDGETEFLLKPMNCPSHMMLFNAESHSYRDLPLRYAEFATLYRYEKSGELNGLTRVRSLTQDDIHVFCTPDQIQEEFALGLSLIREAFETYGLTDYRVALSLPDTGGDGKFVDAPEQWEQAVAALRNAMEASGLEFAEEEGEAAFYGPKADFIAKDVLGREWQLSTIQVDFIQPGRLGCVYTGEDGKEHTPVMLHQAVTGATERFLGVLIEHFGGAFPLWLAPVQATVIPIADRHQPYADEVAATLREAGFRVEVDARSERMNAKIRHATLQKIPYMLVAGDREAEAGTVAVRVRTGEDLGAIPIADFLGRIEEERETKALVP